MAKYLLPTLIFLNDWTIVSVEGFNATKYLQGQLSANIELLQENQHILSAHCNFKGKIWSSLRLFWYKKNICYLIHNNVIAKQLSELKKYAIFDRVIIECSKNLKVLGFAGLNGRGILNSIYSKLPTTNNQVVTNDDEVILFFNQPIERFLLIMPEKKVSIIVNKLRNKVKFSDDSQWLSLDIESGFPVIDTINSGYFMPQEVNMSSSISLEKGCYLGQEVINRIQNSNSINKSLCLLTNFDSTINNFLNTGSYINTRIYNSTINIGRILTILQLENNQNLIQAVINKNILEHNKNINLIDTNINLSVIRKFL